MSQKRKHPELDFWNEPWTKPGEHRVVWWMWPEGDSWWYARKCRDCGQTWGYVPTVVRGECPGRPEKEVECSSDSTGSPSSAPTE